MIAVLIAVCTTPPVTTEVLSASTAPLVTDTFVTLPLVSSTLIPAPSLSESRASIAVVIAESTSVFV